ncbi:AraC family transcriptional regulator [Clostridium estertheticum]|uniref:helix-turn-helix domain-containing protein n=1 Tax=Clostridium estertheticum TaxID=238834 RepID=UPI0013E924A1|nr:AraC family transcriptional regulator [Clostridium estertheticum]MBZ9689817.1 AraC family transcriptional regulator [Clostridium estertheticum]
MEKYALALQCMDGDVIEIATYDSSINYLDFNILIGYLNLHIIDLIKVIPNENWSASEHYHTFFELHIIPQGKGFINIEGTDFDVKARQLYITAPYVKHIQLSNAKDPMSEYCLKFELSILNNLQINNSAAKKEITMLKDMLSRTYPFAFEDTFETRSKFQQVFFEVKHRNLGYQLKIQILITDIIIDVLRTVSSTIGSIPKYAVLKKSLQQERIERIEKFIKNNFMNSISLKDLSSFLFLSTRQINRIMEKELSLTFHAYLLNERFKFAIEQLEETSLSIEEISYKSGFSSPIHLYQVFKRFGIPNPSKIRHKEKLNSD